MYHVLRKSNGVETIDPAISKELDRYVKIEYFQKIEDWNKPNQNEIFDESNWSSKRCDIADLGNDTFAEEIYEQFINDKYAFDLFCPDFDKTDYKIQSTKGSMFLKSFFFRVEKCNE